MRIIVDVTEMYRVDFITGIQRVIKEITTRWIKNDVTVLLIVYDFKNRHFWQLDNEAYYDYYTGKRNNKDFIKQNIRITVEDFTSSDVFFDMDSVWMNSLKRSHLLPKLKARGVKLAVNIYDLIPVQNPQHCHEFVVFNFMEYLGAYLKYGDLIFTNAQATLDAMNCLIQETEVTSIQGVVARLGSDIVNKTDSLDVQSAILDVVKKTDYVLMVGTIEPRKNHRYVLEAFERELFDNGMNLIFAGRVGWNVEEFVKYIQQHEQFGKRLFWFDNASDDDITYLYENALVVAFPSFNEGFGLPIIESIERGTPVVATDIPVLREVGGTYCEYFSLERVDEFISLIKEYVSNPAKYKELKSNLKYYRRYTWDECANQILRELKSRFVEDEK